MEMVLNNNDGFKHIVEVSPAAHPPGYKLLKFTTVWDHARRDGSAQTQFEIILSQQQLANLKDFL
jgi:hypothetical protein